jgi:hypothetical protein
MSCLGIATYIVKLHFAISILAVVQFAGTTLRHLSLGVEVRNKVALRDYGRLVLLTPVCSHKLGFKKITETRRHKTIVSYECVAHT